MNNFATKKFIINLFPIYFQIVISDKTNYSAGMAKLGVSVVNMHQNQNPF